MKSPLGGGAPSSVSTGLSKLGSTRVGRRPLWEVTASAAGRQEDAMTKAPPFHYRQGTAAAVGRWTTGSAATTLPSHSVKRHVTSTGPVTLPGIWTPPRRGEVPCRFTERRRRPQFARWLRTKPSSSAVGEPRSLRRPRSGPIPMNRPSCGGLGPNSAESVRTATPTSPAGS